MSVSAARRALVTGITGQDGAYLAELLAGKGYQVFGLARRSSREAGAECRLARLGVADRVSMVPGDVTDLSSLVRAVREVRPDEVYNLAAQSFVGASWNQPLLTAEVTGRGAVHVLEAVRLEMPEARVYQASSSEMFGRAAETPQRETTPFRPRSPYGVAKLAAHWATVNYRESFGMHVSCGILFNHESPLRGIEFVSRKITDGVARIHLGLASTLKLGNLGACRDWGHAADYVRAMWLMLQQDAPDDYVIATGETRCVGELAEAAFRQVGRCLEDHVTVDSVLLRPAEVELLRGDAAKARERLGWRPEIGFEQMIEEMVAADLDRHERWQAAA